MTYSDLINDISIVNKATKAVKVLNITRNVVLGATAVFCAIQIARGFFDK